MKIKKYYNAFKEKVEFCHWALILFSAGGFAIVGPVVLFASIDMAQHAFIPSLVFAYVGSILTKSAFTFFTMPER